MDIGARKHRIILAIFFQFLSFIMFGMVYYFLKNAESFGPTQVLSCKSLLSREKFIMKMISRKIFYYCCLHSCWPLTLEGSKSGSSSSSSPSSPSSSSSSSSSNSSSSRASPKKVKNKLVKIQHNYNFFRENKITNMFMENKSGCSFHIKLNSVRPSAL